MHDDSCPNPSANRELLEIVDARFGRRALLGGGVAMAVGTFFGRVGLGAAAAAPGVRTGGALAFTPVAPNTLDAVTIPVPGYLQQVLVRWGDPLFSGQAAMPPDVGHTQADAERQFGMHADGMHYFPLRNHNGRQRGILCVNNEYIDDGLLHPDARVTWNLAKVQKSQASQGVSILEVSENADGTWSIVLGDRNRRITPYTPMDVTGPAAGSSYLLTAADPKGHRVLGTVNNCAHGSTPWGTYLTCEENFNGNFGAKAAFAATADQARYGLSRGGFGYRWHEFDARWDLNDTPNEANRFGWVVEIDPMRPGAKPRKRTALGRIKHEGATTTESADGRIVAYMGDDERGEYVYKFVGNRPWSSYANPFGHSPLDDGVLHVARFNEDGTGSWLPLVQGTGPLTAAAGFPDQAYVLTFARRAADALGATRMDRPEWVAVDPESGEVYVALTNNSNRGVNPSQPVNAANPRKQNSYGHIVKWTEAGGDNGALAFEWDIFLLGGNPTLPEYTDPARRPRAGRDPNGAPLTLDNALGSPDGLWFGYDGTLWIQTDISSGSLNAGDYAGLGNNQMLAADVATGEVKRFLVGPKACEVTGVTSTPDCRYLFVGIQHPGETSSEISDPANPKAISSWPDGDAFTRPRSSVVVIRRDGGGPI